MLAGPGSASQQALALRHNRVDVRAHVDLDTNPGRHDEAFLDVWTPEVAPRVALLRESGCVVRCLGDLVLERSTVPTIGVTGTAGKTTTAAFLAYLLRSAGVTVHTSTTARAANLWPTGELVPPPQDGVVLMEPTSSHLCFTTRSPTIAVITCFWPDHLELHGSLERYRAAKEAIVRWQGPDDVVVVNEGDPAAAAIADRSLGRRFGFSTTGEVDAGAFVHGDEVVLRDTVGERSFRAPPRLDAPRLQALLAAAATTLAAGALPEQLGPPQVPPFRATRVGKLGATELIDDGMAATPAKTASALRKHARGRSSSSRAESSRTRGCRSTPRRRNRRCSRRHVPRPAVSHGSSSSSGPPPSASLRSSIEASRFAPTPSTRRSSSPRATPRTPRCSSSRRCSRCRSPIESGSHLLSRRSRGLGNRHHTPALLVLTSICCASSCAPTREE